MPSISLSSPFPVKNRCKKCGSNGVFYFYSPLRELARSPGHAEDIFWIKIRFNEIKNDDLFLEPIFFKLRDLSFQASNFNSYNPRLHMTRGTEKKPNIMEGLMCRCYKTAWLFSKKSSDRQMEIHNRKSNRVFPISKFKY